jgi:hypothetical protein
MSDSVKDIPEKRKPGRPKDSRNKSTLMKAQILIDGLTLDAVGYLEAMMRNDKDKLDCKDDVPYSIRFNATKEILAKGIANEKEKSVPTTSTSTSETEDGKKVHTGPQVFATAK